MWPPSVCPVAAINRSTDKSSVRTLIKKLSSAVCALKHTLNECLMMTELFILNLDVQHGRVGEASGVQDILVKLAWSWWNVCWLTDETLCS